MPANSGFSSPVFSFAGQLQLNFKPNLEEAIPMPKPGEWCAATARYRCPKCGNTIIVNKGERMPPCGVCKNRGVVWQRRARLT